MLSKQTTKARATLRQLKFVEALREATEQCMKDDARVFIMGLGVPDPKGIFGSTLNLEKKFGPKRVMDMPTSENAMTGVIIGAALGGLKPILTHQRLDFALLSLEQIINQAAKWHYMFGGKMKVPFVIRMIIGRGWGQGPQHSQSLHSLFSHIPGLKVLMPATAYDAKGLLVSAIKDDNPVIFLEHRWLYETKSVVPENIYQVPIGEAKILKKGKDVTIVSFSYGSLEALKAAEFLEQQGISAEVIDLRSLLPLDEGAILTSVKKTGRLLVMDLGWKFCGYGAEIISLCAEKAFSDLKASPIRVALPPNPTPTSPALAKHFYPSTHDIVKAAYKLVGKNGSLEIRPQASGSWNDVPDANFRGPF